MDKNKIDVQLEISEYMTDEQALAIWDKITDNEWDNLSNEKQEILLSKSAKVNEPAWLANYKSKLKKEVEDYTNGIKAKELELHKKSLKISRQCTIISVFVYIVLFAMFFSVLVFYAKIFDEYKETAIVRQNNGEDYNVYKVDDIEYKAYYNFTTSSTTQYEKTIWYSIKNPEKYIYARRSCIIGFSIACAVMVLFIGIKIYQYIFIDKKKYKNKLLLILERHKQ